MKVRIQKYMASCGIASRRKAEEIVRQGRVSVNGKIIDDVMIIDDENDVVEVDGSLIKPEENKVYIMLNKPVGVITSAKDQFSRKTVLDLIQTKERVYPAGRLDYDTSGLVILTNDGDAVNRMTHPSHELSKVYDAEIIGHVSKEEKEQFESGLDIEDYTTSSAELQTLKEYSDSSVVRITIHEGKNRQVRKMCEKIGHPVLRLKRVQEGQILLGSLKEGEWRYLTDKEVEYIKSI